MSLKDSKVDDTIDYLAIKNVMKIFKLSKRRVTEVVIGKELDLDIGMPDLLRGVYKLQHHWSQRVYERAVLLSQRYLSGLQAKGLHNLTNLHVDLC